MISKLHYAQFLETMLKISTHSFISIGYYNKALLQFKSILFRNRA